MAIKKIRYGKLFWANVIAFLMVPLITSGISTWHVIDFFQLSSPDNTLGFMLSVLSAAAFEVGLLSSLIALAIISKIKEVEWVVVGIFLLLTVYQCAGNSYFAYHTVSIKMETNPNLLNHWAELLWLQDYISKDIMFVKRVYSWAAGGILPIISLGFWHLLARYIKKMEDEKEKARLEYEKENAPKVVEKTEEPVAQVQKVEIIKPETQPQTEIKSEPVISPPVIIQPEPAIVQPVVAQIEPVALQEEIKAEPETVQNSPEEVQKTDFKKVLEEKKDKLQRDRNKYLPLLSVLFNSGEFGKDDILPSYVEFIELVNRELYSDDDVKTFLTLCNYLDITSLSDNVRKALKNYDEAKKILGDYLTLNNV